VDRLSIANPVSPLHKLMAAAVVFFAATLMLLMNFFTSSIDNVAIAGGAKGFYFVPLALVVYYGVAWSLVRRCKPESQPIVVQYRPPEGITPAEARYIYTLNCDGRTYVACTVGLAARGIVKIEQTHDGVYLRSTIERPTTEWGMASALPASIPDEEKWVFCDLFQQGQIAFLHPPRQGLLNYIWLILQQRPSAKYYDFPASVLMAGLAIMSVTALWVAGREGLLTPIGGRFDLKVAIFVGAALFSAGVASFFFWQHNRRAVLLASRGIYPYRTLPFLLGALLIMPGIFWWAMHLIAPVFANVTVLMLLVNTFAPAFLMGYTEQGNKVMRELLGFRQFLESTDQDRLNRLAPTAEEAKSNLSLLAYAIALDIREAWGDRMGAEAMVETALDRVL